MQILEERIVFDVRKPQIMQSCGSFEPLERLVVLMPCGARQNQSGFTRLKYAGRVSGFSPGFRAERCARGGLIGSVTEDGFDQPV